MNRIRRFVQEPPPFFAKLMVVLAAMIWGSAFLVMKNTLDGMGPFTILAVRLRWPPYYWGYCVRHSGAGILLRCC